LKPFCPVDCVETLPTIKSPIRDYLCSILPGLANFPINRIATSRPPLGWALTAEIWRRVKCAVSKTLTL
jgi:hypothetical protein